MADKETGIASVRIAAAQIDAVLGDIIGNGEKVLERLSEAESNGADIIVFPELVLPGYPPRDLLFKPRFIQDNIYLLQNMTHKIGDIVAIIGFVDRKNGKLYNSAAVATQGRLVGAYQKKELPNYGVFDEKRYFTRGRNHGVFYFEDCVFGVNICEDIWFPRVTKSQAREGGAEIIINISSSPYHAGKGMERENMLRRRALTNTAHIVYVNLVGGQDELVFDGDSIIMDYKGRIINRAKQFETDIIYGDLDLTALREEKRKRKRLHSLTRHSEGKRTHISFTPRKMKTPLKQLPHKRITGCEEIYKALVTGLRDYSRKNGFKGALVGLSGGIDSALTLVLAADALGPENVTAICMPSPYSSRGSIVDSRTLTEKLNVSFLVIPIDKGMKTFDDMLNQYFKDRKPDETEENIQARIRGIILMAFSNKFGKLVLATGNKSELSVGYCTLYGDMVGGFAVLKDVPKTLVYKLSEFRNKLAGFDLIPQDIIDKPPSAELKPDQTDQDILPPYEILDPIMELYIVENKSIDEIMALGYEKKTVIKVIDMIDSNEYKRRQGPPGIKISQRALGEDHRMPITNKYEEILDYDVLNSFKPDSIR